ncbi:response regulator transcription factor [Lentibacillus saliphilus]|uniref:response regulator transcription factor n=1 Tax=Lentibacillus saliphilus TaxID=2737028 RepID=UPI001C2FF723|nr:response regulator [Lentibacillus saliphilus]
MAQITKDNQGKINILDGELLPVIFSMQTASVARSKMTFTLLFMSPQQIGVADDWKADPSTYEVFTDFLIEQIRDSDMLFLFPTEKVAVLLLPFSGEVEAAFAVERMKKNYATIDPYRHFYTAVVEIANSHAQYDDVWQNGMTALALCHSQPPFAIEAVDWHKEREIETIKVSIIEPDETTKMTLRILLERMSLSRFTLMIETYHDGHDFLTSRWHTSGHTHLVMMNDILPRQNGVEVLNELRLMPNSDKYIIFMMSDKQSESNMLYAYEKDADEYIVKPFNIKLLEAKIKRVLKRLR